ncbi:MAG: enoyl-CoA hydratase/isomerase family protein [Candidatus Cloacimonetes bacterium]|nr:enoyl-CoA hydratase/isomerase family protein [Candidatus Cloacimonadota bacterium]
MQYFEMEKDSGIFTLKFSREKVLNALNKDLITEGIAILDTLKMDQELKVLILTGKGEKAFVAGADIGELALASVEDGRDISELGHQFLKKIEEFPCPVIACINGFALGGGLEVALACDLRYAADTAKMGLPEVSLGLIPGYGGTQRLSRLIGVGKASEYVFTGEMVTAQEALSDGLVQGVFPKAELVASVRQIAEKIAAKAPLAVMAAKRSIRLGYSLDLGSALKVETLEFAQICGTSDKQEGTKAFLEKRPARFQRQ